MATKCPRCQEEVSEGNKICHNCGYKLVPIPSPAVDNPKSPDAKGTTIKKIDWDRIKAAFIGGIILGMIGWGAILGMVGKVAEVPYAEDGLCDVCGAPAYYVAEVLGSNGSTNEFCYPHALQWRMTTTGLFLQETPMEIFLPMMLVLVLLCAVGGLIVYTIYHWIAKI